MANNQYHPSPIEVDNIELDLQLLELTEVLAKNAHDIWATKRFNEGWIFGNERCDIKKTNPCLVPYEELPDSEKEYDRQTAIGTIKVIISLGCKITIEHPLNYHFKQ